MFLRGILFSSFSTIFHSPVSYCGEFTREKDSFGRANLLNFNQWSSCGGCCEFNRILTVGMADFQNYIGKLKNAEKTAITLSLKIIFYSDLLLVETFYVKCVIKFQRLKLLIC